MDQRDPMDQKYTLSLFSDYERMTHSVWRSHFFRHFLSLLLCCTVRAFVAIISLYDIEYSNTKRRRPNPKQLHFSPSLDDHGIRKINLITSCVPKFQRYSLKFGV